MSETFVPFGVKAVPMSSSEPFRAKIISSQNTATLPFKPVLAFLGATGAHAPSHGQPQVTLTREGDRITSIRVICGCGEVMDLRCTY